MFVPGQSTSSLSAFPDSVPAVCWFSPATDNRPVVWQVSAAPKGRGTVMDFPLGRGVDRPPVLPIPNGMSRLTTRRRCRKPSLSSSLLPRANRGRPHQIRRQQIRRPISYRRARYLAGDLTRRPLLETQDPSLTAESNNVSLPPLLLIEVPNHQSEAPRDVMTLLAKTWTP
jgi:hypothetical protein